MPCDDCEVLQSGQQYGCPELYSFADLKIIEMRGGGLNSQKDVFGLSANPYLKNSILHYLQTFF